MNTIEQFQAYLLNRDEPPKFIGADRQLSCGKITHSPRFHFFLAVFPSPAMRLLSVTFPWILIVTPPRSRSA